MYTSYSLPKCMVHNIPNIHIFYILCILKSNTYNCERWREQGNLHRFLLYTHNRIFSPGNGICYLSKNTLHKGNIFHTGIQYILAPKDSNIHHHLNTQIFCKPYIPSLVLMVHNHLFLQQSLICTKGTVLDWISNNFLKGNIPTKLQILCFHHTSSKLHHL